MQNPAVAYDEYLGPAMFAPSAQLTLTAAQIQPHERVLDVACGTGILTKQIRAARVVGLDVSPRMLAVARAAPGIEWVEGSAMALPFEDGAFDAVLCQHGLQFYGDRAAGAREMRRVAGRAVVSCWQAAERQAFMGTVVNAQAKLLGVTAEEVGLPWRFGDPEALRALLREAGFTHVEVVTHVIDARFRAPERFMQMMVDAAITVMPERFGRVDPSRFAADLRAACAGEMARYVEGDSLRFPMPTNVARAW
jgi:SAM-dependent methyltransferase